MLWKCAPRQNRRHISESRFLPTSCAKRRFHAQNGFKTITLGGAFPPCAVQKIVGFADWAENGRLGKPFFNIACIFACILDQIFRFLVLILPLLWELYLMSPVFLHVFGMRFLYSHSWFCHSSGKLYLTSLVFSHVFGTDFYTLTLDFVSPPGKRFF